MQEGTSAYQRALHRLLSLTDLERMRGQGPARTRYDLGRMYRFLDRLGRPHLKVPTVHIAGTKGKGSTSAMMTSVLEAAGYAVGLYTSPHLHTFRERLRLGLEPLREEEFAGLVEKLWPTVEEMGAQDPDGRVTTFEMLTAMAFVCFAGRSLDFQVLEVGLGGRLDATNVVERPLACIITSLSLDHQAVLGTTLEAIASEKAGIIKPGVHVVTAPQAPEAMAVVAQRAGELGAPLVPVAEEYRWQREAWDLEGQRFLLRGPEKEHHLWVPLLGEHQLENAVCVLAGIEALRRSGVAISDDAVARGFRQVQWPGRLEVLSRSPLIVADGAHNPYSMEQLRKALLQYFQYESLVLVFGAMEDKDNAGMVAALALLHPKVIVTRTRHPRAALPPALAGLWAKHGIPAWEAPDVPGALQLARRMAGGKDLVLGTGSLFLAAEFREAIKGIPPEIYPELQPQVPLPGRRQ